MARPHGVVVDEPNRKIDGYVPVGLVPYGILIDD